MPTRGIKALVPPTFNAQSTERGWFGDGVIDENYGRSDSAFVVKLVLRSANTFGIILAFEKVWVPSLGLTGRSLKCVRSSS